MHRAQEQVRDFHRALDVPAPKEPKRLGATRIELRLNLIYEEMMELVYASKGKLDEDRVGIVVHASSTHPSLSDQIDALCDLLYVTYGMAIEMGIDLEPFFELVHEANMKKVGGPTRPDGKKLKPKGWAPPDIEGLLRKIDQ